MTEKYVTLIGAEQVQTASRLMGEAAAGMNRAASNLDEVLERNRRFMDDWLARFEQILDNNR